MKITSYWRSYFNVARIGSQWIAPVQKIVMFLRKRCERERVGIALIGLFHEG